jgi:hypothetical protein
MVLAVRYAGSPGDSASAPAHWPVASKIERGTNTPTLLVFMHPHCPCSQATMGEFELLLAQTKNAFATHILFVVPKGASNEWAETALLKRAREIKETVVLVDTDGIEAQRFGAETSGTTLLYSAEGDLLFNGGITKARAHAGDNAGRDALVAFAGHAKGHALHTPVFGCPLFDRECRAEGTVKESHD